MELLGSPEFLCLTPISHYSGRESANGFTMKGKVPDYCVRTCTLGWWMGWTSGSGPEPTSGVVAVAGLTSCCISSSTKSPCFRPCRWIENSNDWGTFGWECSVYCYKCLHIRLTRDQKHNWIICGLESMNANYEKQYNFRWKWFQRDALYRRNPKSRTCIPWCELWWYEYH